MSPNVKCKVGHLRYKHLQGPSPDLHHIDGATMRLKTQGQPYEPRKGVGGRGCVGTVRKVRVCKDPTRFADGRAREWGVLEGSAPEAPKQRSRNYVIHYDTYSVTDTHSHVYSISKLPAQHSAKSKIEE